MKKKLIILFQILFALVALAVVIYFLGPKPAIPVLDPNPVPILQENIESIEQYVRNKDNKTNGIIKEDNEARIIWADDAAKVQTEYAFVYLHGFSASWKEGDPVHRDIAKHYGANLYLPRLDKHGLESDDAFVDLTANGLLQSTKEAIAVAKVLGKKVILLTTSTGSTSGLFLASADSSIAAVVCYSPNIDIYDTNSELLIGPWGLELARIIFGGNYRKWEANEEVQRYWENRSRIEGLIQLKLLVKATMKEEVFQQVTQPLYLAYYYKNEEEQDKVISVKRALEMYEQLGTPDAQKRKDAFTEVAGHVFCSEVYETEENLNKLKESTQQFLEEVVGLVPQ